MQHIHRADHHTLRVKNFEDLISTPYCGDVNAICWARELKGDFSEIVDKLPLPDNVTEVAPEELHELQLSEQGQLAREVLLNDLELLKACGASPVLNVISHYDRDEYYPFFPTDVYSFHADRSPVPTDTFLCTYYGTCSEIVPNAEVRKKVLIPQIREMLRKLYAGANDGFESFLSEHSFDLHYEAMPGAQPVNLGIGNLWKLAVEHPESAVLPCIHRAPKEKNGQKRLLLIC